MSESKWDKPQDVSDLDIAFGGHVRELMPTMQEMGEKYGPNVLFNTRDNKWVNLFTDMFYRGVKNLKLTPKAGIDDKQAWRHLRAIAGSFEPQHEHKEAAFVYLCEHWFDDVSYEPAKQL